MRYWYISFYVEWKGAEEAETISELLSSMGAELLESEGSADPKEHPGLMGKHARTVFRVRVDWSVSVNKLLSAVEKHPSVHALRLLQA